MIVLQASTRNSLLAAMTAADFALLSPDLIRLPLPVALQLHRADTKIDRVYFPEDGIASIVDVNEHGKSVEVGMFGRTGMSSTAVVLGANRSAQQTYMQVAGVSGIRLPSATLRQAMAQSETLRTLLLRYVQTMMAQVTSSAAAAASRTLLQRLARWLLMCHDRTDSNELRLTHEFISMMLGARRAGITVALRILETSGLILARRSNIEVLDRAGLEQLAGDSYGSAEHEYHRLIGTVLRGGQARRGVDGQPLAF